MEIIAHQEFGEWVCKLFYGVYIHHIHNIVCNILPNKLVSKRHGFLFMFLPLLVAFDATLMLSTYTVVGLDTMIPINIMWYPIITDSSTDFFGAVNSAPNIEVFTAV